MRLLSAARPHAAVLAVLAVSGVLAFTLPTFASDQGVLPLQGCTCHSDNPNLGVNITVEGWPAIYTPGEAYPLTLTAVGDVAGTKGGFNAEVSKGSLSSADPLVAASGRFATHTGPDERSWPLLWIAPPEDSGGVRLAIYANLVNGDGSEGPEDHWNFAEFLSVEKAPEPPKPSNLHLTFEADTGAPIAGHNVTIVAYLSNFTDRPIPNANVSFWAHLSFGLLPLGANKTDANGSARVNWTPIAEGEFLFLAAYDGSSKNMSSNVSATVAVVDPERVFESYYGAPRVRHSGMFDAVRVPLFLIVGGVWVTFGFAGRQVLRVRKQGNPADDGPRALFRLLVPQFGKLGRKKP